MVPGSAHDAHGPVHAVAQQTPCAQWPLLHSLSVVQVPKAEVPHRPFRQVAGDAQSWGPVQLSLHVSPPGPQR